MNFKTSTNIIGCILCRFVLLRQYFENSFLFEIEWFRCICQFSVILFDELNGFRHHPSSEWQDKNTTIQAYKENNSIAIWLDANCFDLFKNDYWETMCGPLQIELNPQEQFGWTFFFYLRFVCFLTLLVPMKYRTKAAFNSLAHKIVEN